MNERGFAGVFFSALIIGAVATFSVYKLVVAQRLPASANVKLVSVVVAAEDIPEGAALVEANLRVREYAEDAVPAGSFADVDSLLERVTLLPIVAREPVLEGKLAPVGSAAGLEIKIAPGRRAMAIPINDHVGINGFVQPNSRVDVLVTFRSGSRLRNETAKVFLQNMRVLSVGQHLRRGDDGKPITANTVTLEVSPEEAELLAVAMNEGILQLALRGYADEDSIKTNGATAYSVLAAARKYRPRAAAPPKAEPDPEPVLEPTPAKVQIFRGTEMTERTVTNGTAQNEAAKKPPTTGGGK